MSPYSCRLFVEGIDFSWMEDVSFSFLHNGVDYPNANLVNLRKDLTNFPNTRGKCVFKVVSHHAYSSSSLPRRHPQPIKRVFLLNRNACQTLSDIFRLFYIITAHDGNLLHPRRAATMNTGILHDASRLGA